MSYALSSQHMPNLVLDRGHVAHRWRTERWNSLRLLTPNFLNRLPGWEYQGSDPDGFMTVPEFIAWLEGYAHSFDAPIQTGVNVQRVRKEGQLFEIHTGQQRWLARSLVIATGHCDVPYIPPIAQGLDGSIDQLVPSNYKQPAQLAPGGVLIVGSGATGVQLAEELAEAGRRVFLSVGTHRRRPRNYLGKDILWWACLLYTSDAADD